MRQKTLSKHKPADTLLKTSRRKKKDIELTEQELGKVSGGAPKMVGVKTVSWAYDDEAPVRK